MRPIVSIVVLLHVLYQPPSPAPDQRAKPSTRQVTTTPADSLSSKNLSHTPAAQSILQVGSLRTGFSWRPCLVRRSTRLYSSEVVGSSLMPMCGLCARRQPAHVCRQG